MSRNVALQHCRGVNANLPTLSAGELYCATDTGRVYHGTTPSRLAAIAAEVDLTAQSAAIAATTIFTPAATAMYKVSFYLKVTRAATTSSTLGGLTITFSDGTDSVAQSHLGIRTDAGRGDGNFECWQRDDNYIERQREYLGGCRYGD